MPILLLLVLFLKVSLGRGGSVQSWVDWHRKAQSWVGNGKINVIRCQRFRSRGKFLSKGSALVYSCDWLFLSVFINIFSDLKRISVLSMYLTKQISFFPTPLQVRFVRYLNLPMLTTFKDVFKPSFLVLIVSPTLQKGRVFFFYYYYYFN